MNSIKAIIVDDEVDAREVLHHLIKMTDYPVEIIGVCDRVEEAVKTIKSEQPDVVFLDVKMPNYAGYEIVDFFDEINFEIIFITAYDNYALKAFELYAVDYLLKPINRNRLNIALERLVHKLATKSSIQKYQLLLDKMRDKSKEKIIISEQTGKRILQLNEIVCFQGQGSYSVIYLTTGEKILSSKNLRHYENVLEEFDRFFRSQKSWLVNTEHILSYQLGQGNIHLSNDITAKISINKTDEFKVLMKE